MTQKRTKKGSWLKFVVGVCPYVRPARTAKGAKKKVVRLSVEKDKIGGSLTNGRRRHAVNQVDHCVESLRPKTMRDRRMSHESETCLDNMTMFPLCRAILLRHMRTKNMM